MTTCMQGWWGNWTVKPLPQMQQETATVLAVGGATHIGIPTYRNGTHDPMTLKALKDTFAFIKAREPFLQGIGTDIRYSHFTHRDDTTAL